MTPTIAEVEALRELATNVSADRERVRASDSAWASPNLVSEWSASATPEFVRTLCDYWLAAHRSDEATIASQSSTPATPNIHGIGPDVNWAPSPPSGAGGSAGTLSVEDAELCEELDCDGIVSESPMVHKLIRLCRKAAARIEALSRERDSAVAQVAEVMDERCRMAEARAEALERDAARYRWLRSQILHRTVYIGYEMREWMWRSDNPREATLNGAIDAALAQKAKP